MGNSETDNSNKSSVEKDKQISEGTGKGEQKWFILQDSDPKDVLDVKLKLNPAIDRKIVPEEQLKLFDSFEQINHNIRFLSDTTLRDKKEVF